MNYSEIIEQLAEANRKLIDGKISVDIAKQIGINTQVLINGARLQFDVIKHSEKYDTGFFVTGIDSVMDEIESAKVQTYQFDTTKLSNIA